jgi:hypothetical protein
LCPGSLRLQSSYLCPPHNWDYRHQPPCSDGLLRWGLLNFLPGLALSFDPPISASCVAGITDVTHGTWLYSLNRLLYCKKF